MNSMKKRTIKCWIWVIVLFLAIGIVPGIGNMAALAETDDSDAVSLQIPADQVTPEMVKGVEYLLSHYPQLTKSVKAAAEDEKLKISPNSEIVDAVIPQLQAGTLFGIPVQEIPGKVVSALSGSELGQTLLAQIAGLLSSGSISIG